MLTLIPLVWPSFVSGYDGDASRAVEGSQPPAIQIRTTPEELTQVHVYEETIPEGFYPVRISHGGTFDTLSGTIKWGPFPDNTEKTLEYELLGPQESVFLQGFGVYGMYPVAVQRATRGVSLVTLPSPLSSYESWAFAGFGPADFRKTEAAPTRSSGSGVANAVAYAAGAAPGSSIHDIVKLSREIDGELRLEIQRNSFVVEHPLRLWYSDNLNQWTEWDFNGPEIIETFLPDGREYLRLRLAPVPEAFFYRLTTNIEGLTGNL